MLISEILAEHNSYKEQNSFNAILGDAFLMHHNPVYRNIRNCSIEMGCKYAEADIQYLVLPLHSLSEITANKTIPYIPGGRLLQEVENKCPQVLTTEDLTIPESHQLHEAAHVIAEHLFQKGFAIENDQIKVLKTILCESFANTVDALPWIFVDSNQHRFFLEYNSYMQPIPPHLALLKRMSKEMGLGFTAMMTLVSYLHSNFLVETISPKWIELIAEKYAPNVKLNPKIIKDCHSMMKMAERLDPLFRVQTTQMYFKLQGYKKDIHQLLNFPFMKVFIENDAFAKVSGKMVSLILK